MQWFDAFLYIFSKHWNRVDNFRIDKFLMILRLHLSEVMKFLKESNYEKSNVEWFNNMITRTLEDSSENG